MMGMPLSPEMQAKVNEAVAARKAKVAASLGKTVEELDAAQHEAVHGHAHDDGDGCACGHEHGRGHEAEPAQEAPEVDERAVLDFIRSRQATIERQRAQIRALTAEKEHLGRQLELSEKKCATLRDALAKVRAELKAVRQAPEAGGVDGPAAE